MENIKENLDFIIPMMEGIAGQFGENCEVVLHHCHYQWACDGP